MTLQDTLRIGPLNLPVRYLVLIGALLVGYAVMSILLASRPHLRKPAANRLVNAFLTFVVIWKLEPPIALLATGIFSGRVDWSAVGLQLFVPGGTLATLLGLAGGGLYLVSSILRAAAPEQKAAGTTPQRAGSDATGGPSAGPGAHMPATSSEQAGTARGPRTLTARRLPAALSVAAALIPALVVYLVAVWALSPGNSPSVTGAPSRATAAVGTSVGDRAPDFRAQTLGGTSVAFNGTAGKTVVLNFWATWCPPCRAELPDLVRFSSDPRNAHVQVWAVDMTGTEPSANAVRTFAKEHQIDFPILTDPNGSIARAFRVSAVPTTYIISPDGVIRAKQVGAMSPSWLRRQAASR